MASSNSNLHEVRKSVRETLDRNLSWFGGGGRIPAWNLPAKFVEAKRIADDERQQHIGHHNDIGDAMRHAEWSKRMADDLGPGFSTLVGRAHEIQGTLPKWLPKWVGGESQPLAEGAMDLINNAEGIAASRESRPINPWNLQDRPIGPRQAIRERTSY